MIKQSTVLFIEYHFVIKDNSRVITDLIEFIAIEDHAFVKIGSFTLSETNV